MDEKEIMTTESVDENEAPLTAEMNEEMDAETSNGRDDDED